jgi:hypothetical protein
MLRERGKRANVLVVHKQKLRRVNFDEPIGQMKDLVEEMMDMVGYKIVSLVKWHH